MAPKFCNAKALKTGSSGWTVNVQVLQRFPPMLKKGYAAGNRNKFQRLVLLDMEGTLISAVMYDDAIHAFPHLLHPYKRYKISNALIGPVFEQFRLGDYDHTWTISNRTPIELLEDVMPEPVQCPFQLVPFTELYKHADKQNSINIMGLIVHIFPKPESCLTAPTRKITVLTPEKIPVNLAIWLNAENDCSVGIDDDMILPVCILATNLRVSTYDGISFSTQKFSYLMLNPPMVETASLLQWFAASEINSSLWQPDIMHKNPHRFFRVPQEDEILLLKEAVDNIFKLRTVWVRGELRYNNGSRGPCAVICGNCKKALDTEPASLMTCMFCQKYCLTELSLRINFQLSDKSHSISVSMTSPLADQILSMSAEEMLRNNDQNLLPMKIEQAINNRHYTCLMKVFYTTFKEQTIPHYSILQFYAGEVYGQSSTSREFDTIQTPTSSLPYTECSTPGTPSLVNPTNKASGKSNISTTEVRKRLDFNEMAVDESDPKADATSSGRKKGKTE